MEQHLLEFDWDEGNLKHIARHRVTAAEVEHVLTNPTMEIDYRVVNGEERFAEVGVTANGRVLEVVSTFRGLQTRVVTAYDADPAVILEYHLTR